MNDSAKYSLNKADLYKIFRGLMLGVLGYILAWVGSIYLDFSYVVTIAGKTLDFTPIATVGIGSLLEAGRRFLAGYSY